MSKKPDPTCAYCGKPGPLARDHVVPRARGGPDDATNIVMACRACNSAKGDQLPSEWLADKCPQPVLLVESRVHAKLKKSFSYRDRKQAVPAKLYAFTLSDVGRTQYVGEVVSETADRVRLETVNILSLWAGFWDSTGELVDVPRSRCRLFTDVDRCVEAADKQCGWSDRTGDSPR